MVRHTGSDVEVWSGFALQTSVSWGVQGGIVAPYPHHGFSSQRGALYLNQWRIAGLNNTGPAAATLAGHGIIAQRHRSALWPS